MASHQSITLINLSLEDLVATRHSDVIPVIYSDAIFLAGDGIDNDHPANILMQTFGVVVVLLFTSTTTSAVDAPPEVFMVRLATDDIFNAMGKLMANRVELLILSHAPEEAGIPFNLDVENSTGQQIDSAASTASDSPQAIIANNGELLDRSSGSSLDAVTDARSHQIGVSLQQHVVDVHVFKYNVYF